MTETVTHVRTHDLELPRGAGTLAVLTFDNDSQGARPATMGGAGLAELRAALEAQRGRAAAGEIVALAVTGVDDCFLAGADLRLVSTLRTAQQARDVAELGHATLRLLGELAVPTFALVNGLALGGGLEVALHCTYRAVAADVRRLALPEAHLGLVAGWGGTYLAPRLLGIQGGIELALERPLANNRPTDAGTAVATGLVDAMFDRSSFLEDSLDWIARVLSGEVDVPRRTLDDEETWDAAVAAARERLDARLHGARKAPYRTLELLAAARSDDVEAHFAAEDDALEEFLVSDGLHAALYAFDLTSRAKQPAGAPGLDAARPVRSVGIIGAGLMATQLAVLVASRLGVPVVLRDLDDERVAAGRAAIDAQVESMRAKGRIGDDDAARLAAACTVTTELSALAGADLVIEAVTEVLAVKQRVLAELEPLLSSETVLATNTSALSVTAMGAHLEHPERVVGLHFFNPVAQMPLVEVVRTSVVSTSALATAFAVAQGLGKTAVGVADRPGFVVNRLLLRMLGDVAATVDAGTPVEVADRALDPLGLPMRPFKLLDLVGPAVALHVLETLHTELGDRFPLSPGLAALRDAGTRLSTRDGSVDPAIQSAFGDPTDAALDEEGVRRRVLDGLAQEIGAMLDEGVAADVSQIDLCMVLGAGWPIANGGIAPLLDREGVSERVLGRRLLPDGVANVASGTAPTA